MSLRRPRRRGATIAFSLVAAASAFLPATLTAQGPAGQRAAAPAVYRPALKPPEFLEPFAPKVEAGHDAFVDEPVAKAIEAQLRRFGDALKAGQSEISTAMSWLLNPGARGSATPFQRDDVINVFKPFEHRGDPILQENVYPRVWQKPF